MPQESRQRMEAPRSGELVILSNPKCTINRDRNVGIWMFKTEFHNHLEVCEKLMIELDRQTVLRVAVIEGEGDRWDHLVPRDLSFAVSGYLNHTDLRFWLSALTNLGVASSVTYVDIGPLHGRKRSEPRRVVYAPSPTAGWAIETRYLRSGEPRVSMLDLERC